jgi:hypothetical protein
VTRLTIAHTWDGQPLPADQHTFVDLAMDSAFRIRVDAPYAADPPPAGRGSTPRLWEHEVVEVFVFGDGDRYTEIELGPHGHWLVLRLDGVRSVAGAGHAITFRPEIVGSRWTGTAEVERRLLPDAPERINLFRIAGADRRHEALVPVPGPGPDFHQPAVGVGWPF